MPTRKPKNNFTRLCASPKTLAVIARDLRKRKIPFSFVKVQFKKYNPVWKGLKGKSIRISKANYHKYSGL